VKRRVEWLHLTAAGAAYRLPLKPDLTTMQRCVGGYVERLPLGRGMVLWLDEEARIRHPRPPVNELASTVLAHALPYPTVQVLGDALLEIVGPR